MGHNLCSVSACETIQASYIAVRYMIHGADDHFVPLKMTYENYNACASPKKLFLVPGADHGMSYFVDKEGYEMMVKDFWQQFD